MIASVLEDDLRVTVSVGVAVSTGTTASRELLDHADQALYAAKRGGRNRVARFGELEVRDDAAPRRERVL